MKIFSFINEKDIKAFNNIIWTGIKLCSHYLVEKALTIKKCTINI